jgi:hypothetical protein
MSFYVTEFMTSMWVCCSRYVYAVEPQSQSRTSAHAPCRYVCHWQLTMCSDLVIMIKIGFVSLLMAVMVASDASIPYVPRQYIRSLRYTTASCTTLTTTVANQAILLPLDTCVSSYSGTSGVTGRSVMVIFAIHIILLPGLMVLI